MSRRRRESSNARAAHLIGELSRLPRIYRRHRFGDAHHLRHARVQALGDAEHERAAREGAEHLARTRIARSHRSRSRAPSGSDT